MSGEPDEGLILAPVGEVLSGLGVTKSGLSTVRATELLAEGGPNALSVRTTSKLWRSVARQVTHPLALLLWAAAALAATTQGPALAVATRGIRALKVSLVGCC